MYVDTLGLRNRHRFHPSGRARNQIPNVFKYIRIYGLTSVFEKRVIGAEARGVGAGEASPEKIEEMAFSAGGVERLTGDVAATVSADLPNPPRHRPAIAVVREILEVPLRDSDILDILRPHLDGIAASARYEYL